MSFNKILLRSSIALYYFVWITQNIIKVNFLKIQVGLIMTLEELKKHFGTWTHFTREMGFGFTTHLRWLKQGYIPYPSQCVIETKTDKLFKADMEHAKKHDNK